MYDDSDTNATGLRNRAANLRAAAPKAANVRMAPQEQGERLATATRGDREELRFTWTEYNGRPFLSVRVWSCDHTGQWWPTKDKGIAIRRHELADLADAVAAAIDRAEAFARSHGGTP